MAQTIRYSVIVDGDRQTDEYTTDDVNDVRVAWNPEVAESYAQHLAVGTFGVGIDVNTVKIEQLGDSHDNYDETGGVSL